MPLSTIGTNQIADGAVAVADIADGSVTTAKLADDAVTTAKITDANITTAKVANDAITTAKVNPAQTDITSVGSLSGLTVSSGTVNMSSSLLQFSGNISLPNVGACIFRPSADTIAFGINNGQRISVNQHGLLFGTDTTSANALDDYEEGTCNLTWHGTGGTNDSVNTNIKYVKIGKTVTVSGNTNSGTINATGPLELQGLPFTADDDATGAVLYRQTTAASGQHTLVFYVGGNQSKIEPYWAAQGNYDKLNSSDFNGTGQDMYFSITYKAQ